MSQVDKLETLLSRVQERRNEPRASQAQPMPLMAAVPAAAQARSHPTERAAVTEERVSLPGARHSAPQRPVAEARLPAPPAQPVAAPRRPTGGRLSTPLEMALEDELSRPPSSTQTAAHSKAAAAPNPTEPSMAAAPHGPQTEVSDEPFTIEPEPLREAARPIAQVMSKHSTEMDATFGAMLKRSLSLRPR